MKKIGFIILFMIGTYVQVSAQSKIHVSMNVGYLAATKVSGSSVQNQVDGAYGKSLRFYAGYHFTPKYNLNIGFGADRYEMAQANTFPLVLNFRYSVFEKTNTPFVSIEGGRQLAIGSSDLGNVFSGVVGYRFRLSKSLEWSAHAGYTYQNSTQNSYGCDLDVKRQSLNLGLGLIF